MSYILGICSSLAEKKQRGKSGKLWLLSHIGLLTFLFIDVVNPIQDFADFVVVSNFQCLWDDLLIFQLAHFSLSFTG